MYQKNPVDVYKRQAVYSTMFPYTSAGPIVRYTDIETQLKQRTINISKFGIGAELFVKGLAKKVLLADNLSVDVYKRQALDNESERWIQRSLEELSQNRTTITIAHRLSTIRDADEIIVITEDGIAERGTHEELLDMNGVYAAYYNM